MKISKRDALAAALASPLIHKPLGWLVQRPTVLCLNYHRVADDVEYDDAVVSCSLHELAAQAAWLKPHVSILSGDDLEEAIQRRSLDSPCVSLTFDDGYADNLPAGRMLARDYGIQATFFIATGLIESTIVPDWDRIAYSVKRTRKDRIEISDSVAGQPFTIDLDDRRETIRRLLRAYRSLDRDAKRRLVDWVENATGVAAPPRNRENDLFMTWDNIRELKELGHTIGAHTHSHQNLATLSEREQRDELATSRDLIAQQVGAIPRLVSYPFGKVGCFDSRTKAAAADLGFTAGFSFYGGRNSLATCDPFDFKRTAVEREQSARAFRGRAAAPFAI